LFDLLPSRWRGALEPFLLGCYLKIITRGRRFDLVYANTVASWREVRALGKGSHALLWHIHELEYALALLIPDKIASALFSRANRFVAVSASVREALISRYEVPGEVVTMIHGFVTVPDLSSQEKQSRRSSVTAKLGWPSDAFVVGGCGSLGWRKGTDLFLQVAQETCLTRDSANVRFLWVGGEENDSAALEFNYDLARMGLEGRCVRVSSTSDVLDYYCAMNVFALTSREDPFPLVMLEAAAVGAPIVCFEKSGGGPEFIGPDGGLMAPFLDVRAFADRILTLRDNPVMYADLAATAASRARLHHSLAVQGPKLMAVMESCLRTAAVPCSDEERRVHHAS
jgi:glycosyltransferase involved in cell wall biosynthesis